MKFSTWIPVFVLILFAGKSVQAQHSDIEFRYENGKIDVEFGSEGRLFEGDFPTIGLFEQQTDDPGFESEDGSLSEGDIIDYIVRGPLTYHNGTSFAPVPSGAAIVIGDNPTGSLTVEASTTGPISGPGAIAQADSAGEVHTHIEFELTPSSLDVADYGAYGLLMELTTDAPGIANSEAFFLVFNFGLEEAVFEGAVEDFAAIVPEPGAMALLVMGVPWFRFMRRIGNR